MKADLHISVRDSRKPACAERTASLSYECDVPTGQAVPTGHKVSRRSRSAEKLFTLTFDGMIQDVRQWKHSRRRSWVFRLSACGAKGGGASLKTLLFRSFSFVSVLGS